MKRNAILVPPEKYRGIAITAGHYKIKTYDVYGFQIKEGHGVGDLIRKELHIQDNSPRVLVYAVSDEETLWKTLQEWCNEQKKSIAEIEEFIRKREQEIEEARDEFKSWK